MKKATHATTPENLYHYTSLYHLRQILKDGRIRVTCSNLKEPVNLRVVNGSLISDTDDYKPVVWLSDKLDFMTAEDNGLKGSTVDKTECVLVIPFDATKYQRWNTWSKKNHMEAAWKNRLKQVAPGWPTWYVSEEEIPINDNVRIIIRPDLNLGQ